jgi:hypothetical protein
MLTGMRPRCRCDCGWAHPVHERSPPFAIKTSHDALAGMLLSGINDDCIAVEVTLAEKLPLVVHYVALAIAGLVVGESALSPLPNAAQTHSQHTHACTTKQPTLERVRVDGMQF